MTLKDEQATQNLILLPDHTSTAAILSGGHVI
jgi:hypothetical protein